MKKYEILYREIASGFLAGTDRFTQKDLAGRLDISIGNVNRAIKKLEMISAVKRNARSFSVISIERLLLYWASHRNMEKDIIYRARSELEITEILQEKENGMLHHARY